MHARRPTSSRASASNACKTAHLQPSISKQCMQDGPPPAEHQQAMHARRPTSSRASASNACKTAHLQPSISKQCMQDGPPPAEHTLEYCSSVTRARCRLYNSSRPVMKNNDLRCTVLDKSTNSHSGTHIAHSRTSKRHTFI